MKKQKIYLDTSVIGGCFDKEFSKWSNRLINNFKNDIFIPVLSELTSAEIDNAPEIVREKYYEILNINSNILKITEETLSLAEEYQKRLILTKKYFDDGLHIAIATIYNIDILVSWNFKHIVHFDKIRLFNAVNMESGYKPVEIYSPREVVSYGKD